MGNLDQAKSNYGAIVYNKAPSVLKQLNFLVGESAFQAGVRSFLTAHAYANATWRDLLGAVGAAAHKDLTSFGRNFMLRPGMPVVEQTLVVSRGRVVSFSLAQRPAQALSGNAPWPMRTELLFVYPTGSPPLRFPVELSGRTTVVSAAAGKPAPLFAFANADDYGYFLTLLDTASVRSLESGTLGTVTDPLLRTMLWGALWDLVRDGRLDPARFVRLALAELPKERDEQIFPNVVGRMTRALTTYLPDSTRDRLRTAVERALWDGAADTSRPYGLRRACVDAFIGVVASPEGTTRLLSLFSADSVAGEPMRDPTRWEIVNRLTVLDHPEAQRLMTTQAVRDTTPDGRRRAFVAGAARRDGDMKRAYFNRYFADASLNEDWASGSLGAFNASEHAALTLPFLRPALDSLPFIQANRRIFFLGSWLGTFIGGQHSPEGLEVVRHYLADHPRLAKDLRQKVLQTVDELERTVRIRSRWG